MSKKRKLHDKALRGAELTFDELLTLSGYFGFAYVRSAGSHTFLANPNVSDTLNFQSDRGKAKNYQVKQLLRLIQEKGLTLDG